MTQRERFEKYARARSLPLDTMMDGTYYYAATYEAWAAWQAACPEGWLMVPSSPTPEMIEAAEEGHMPFGDMGFAIQCAIVNAPRPGDICKSPD